MKNAIKNAVIDRLNKENESLREENKALVEERDKLKAEREELYNEAGRPEYHRAILMRDRTELREQNRLLVEALEKSEKALIYSRDYLNLNDRNIADDALASISSAKQK